MRSGGNSRIGTKRGLMSLALAAVMLLAGAVAPAGAQQVPPQVLRTIDLGTLPGGNFAMAQAVSPKGTVAGRAIGADGGRHAFLWTESGGMIDLAAFPGAFDVQVNGVNDSGLVVGMVLDGSFVRHVFIASQTLGVIVDPQECVGFCDPGGAVNASGQVVGSHISGVVERGFIWSQATGFTDLPQPAYALGSRALAINDAGQVAGTIILGVGPNITNAIRWTPGVFPDFDFLDLGRISDQSYGTRINAGGDVAGTYGDSSGNFIRGFVWTAASGMVDLSASTVGVLFLIPGGITNGGLIAGELFNSDFSRQAFMYKAGVGLRRLANPPGATDGGAVAVDSFGLATGTVSVSDRRHAAAWQSCQSQDVHPSSSGFTWSFILAANDQSFAVGMVANDDFSVFHAYVWEFEHPGPPPPTPCEFDESTPTAPSDTTPPVVVAQVSGTLGDNGWYGPDVTVSWEVADAESDISSTSGCGTSAVTSDTAGTTFTCTATSAGGTASTSVTIKRDATAPEMSCSVTPNTLWPPNHKMVDVNASVSVSDATSGAAGFTLAAALSNEPDNGLGDGDTPNDIQGFVLGTADTAGQVRAERSGRGNGRVYTLSYTGMDQAGNSASCSATVSVPHDRR